ncbi:hypothetical protein [Longispora albida]|uniref:hypothetical protein n=1 Tax=Longispora albida TaxID=203523 RepID=UPI00036F21D6|nr:hypothetical protein [Longispora albida]
MTRRFAAAALLTAATAAAITVPAAPAQAACSGVTVIVDFGGGRVQSGCAAGDPGSGLAALRNAGFTFTFVPGQNGMVCTVNSVPDPCNGAPANAYWSYWHGQGGQWQYSDVGAGGHNPAPGDVEGWAFGPGKQPGAAPPAPQPQPQPVPTTAPPVPQPQPPAPAQPQPPAPGATRNPGQVQPGATPAEVSPVPAATPAPTAAPTPESTPEGRTAEPSASSEPVPANANAERAADEQGLPWVVGVVLLLVIAGMAAGQVWKRRRA